MDHNTFVRYISHLQNVAARMLFPKFPKNSEPQQYKVRGGYFYTNDQNISFLSQDTSEMDVNRLMVLRHVVYLCIFVTHS